MMKRLLTVSFALVMIVALLAGCATTPAETTPSPDGAVTAAPDVSAAPAAPDASNATPKEIVVNLQQEPPMMNSILTTTTGSMSVLRHILDGLTRLDPHDEPIPSAAESWDISADGLTYTFHLREGMKWNTGDTVTAHDFVFAWTQLFTGDVGAPYGSTWAALILGALEHLEGTALSAEQQAQLTELGYDGPMGFKAIDDYTLQVTTTGPYPYFLSVLAFPNLYPVNEKAYNEIGSDKYGTEANFMATNGAFNFTSWTHENNLVLEKNYDNWDASSIQLTKITMEMIADSGTSYNSFIAGDIDVNIITGLQAEQLRGQGITPYAYDDGSAWYFEFNTTQPGLNNAKVRRAMTLAVDASKFVETVVRNVSKASNSFVPPAIQNGEFAAASGDYLNRVTDDDYSAVKALFEEGLAEENMTVADLKVTLIADDTDSAANYCSFFQEQWKNHIGLEIIVQQMTYKSRIERMQNKDFSVVMAGWGPDYNDPMTFLDIFITGNGNNHTSYSNPEYDNLIRLAMVESDAAKRQEYLLQAEKILMTDLPIGPIYNRSRDFSCSERVTGLVRTAFTDLDCRWVDIVE